MESNRISDNNEEYFMFDNNDDVYFMFDNNNNDLEDYYRYEIYDEENHRYFYEGTDGIEGESLE